MTRQQAVEAAIRDCRERVNEAIQEDLPINRPERLYEASRYLLEAGGKRLRPTILLLAAEALEGVSPGEEAYRSFPSRTGNPVDVLAAAVSVEIIQSFTLIHDDIMDDDDVRRGVPAVHREYDLSPARIAVERSYSLWTAGTPRRISSSSMMSSWMSVNDWIISMLTAARIRLICPLSTVGNAR